MVKKTTAAPGRAGFIVPTTEEIHAEFWPTYRPRRSVAARRLPAPTTVGGTVYRDGYMVRDEHGHIGVMGVGDFEAIYELARVGD
jgi:hypothetical protein